MPANVESSGYLHRLLLIRGFPGMSTISASALSLIAERAIVRRFAKGERLLEEGKPAAFLQLILEGNVLLRRGGVVTEVLGPGTVCGAVTVFSRCPDAPEAEAASEVHALQVPAGDTEEIFRDNFDLTVLALRTLALQAIEARRKAGPTAGYEAELCSLAPARVKTTFADRLDYLSKSLTFAAARLDALADLVRSTEEVRFPAGTLLWSQGERSRDFLVVINGEIDGAVGDQAFCIPSGDHAGLLDALVGLPRWHDARARSAVVALRLDVNSLLDVLEDQPEVALELVADLARAVMALRRARAEGAGRSRLRV